MAVAEDHLGRPVRCPHCQGVVTALAAAEVARPPLQPLSAAEPEPFFGPRSEAADPSPEDRPDLLHVHARQLAR